MINFDNIPSPCFVLDEAALKSNLAIIDRVRCESGAEIIVALKACAMWSIFPELAEHSDGATASSLNEARLVYEYFKTHGDAKATNSPVRRAPHTYAPSYSDADFAEIADYSSHITFNSLAQFERFGSDKFSCGLRINPGYSPVETALYNPAQKGSRLGISSLDKLPAGVEGLHFHVLCESGAEHLKKALETVEQKFGHLLGQIKWLNCGGGHLMTREGYDVDLLIDTIKNFRAKYPHLRVILEPGSAFTWRTGWLVSQVEDIVEADGVRTAMLDVSFACHMPDCLEMPYKPSVVGASDGKGYRLGGSSCLAGDWMGEWSFEQPLKVGDRVVFEDMIHYTMVKTTMFNGVKHPSIAILKKDGNVQIIKHFTYENYKNRMS